MYLNKTPIKHMIEKSEVASEAITQWKKYISQLLADCVETKQVKIEIGNLIIEIDET